MTTEGRGSDLASVALAVAASAFAAAVGLAIWDNWVLNFDGSAYLSLSRSLRESATYRFPDGSFATFRGPGFPAFLAAGQLVVGASVKNAIWIARSVLLVNACLIALIVWRGTRDTVASAIAGTATAVLPWAVVSGATGLVPDALAAGLVLAGIVAVWSDRYSVHLFGGFLIGVGVITKETAIFGIAVAMIVLVQRRAPLQFVGALTAGAAAPVITWWAIALATTTRLPTPFEGIAGTSAWIVIVAATLTVLSIALVTHANDGPMHTPLWFAPVFLVALPAIVFAALLVGAGGLPSGERPILQAVADSLNQELYQETTWWPVLVVALGFVALAVVAVRTPLAVAALGLIGMGLGATIYSAGGRFGIRNGVLTAYGIALALGLAVAAAKAAPRVGQMAMVAAVAAFVVGNAQATSATNMRSADRLVTEQNSVVEKAASWLSGVEAGTVGTTPFYGAAVASQTSSSLDVELLPMYVSSDPIWPQDIDQVVDWLAQRPATQPMAADVIAVSVSSNRITAIDSAAVGAAIADLDHVMLTGNARFNASPFDGGVLLPFFDAAPSATRVWEQINEGAQWIVIYEISHPFVVGEVDPIYRSTDGAPIDGMPALNLVEYSELVKSLVAAQ